MKTDKKILLLIGTPKAGPSASLTLGTALTDRLAERGFAVETVRIAKALRTEDATAEMLGTMDDADLVVLAAPLYADSLPAPVVRAFELAARRRSGQSPREGSAQRFVAIVNCGFPESEQCLTALAICRLFARDAGFAWSGGFPLGMGGGVTGGPLERGPFARTVVPAFDAAADALARGEDIPQEAIDLLSKRAMPRWMYTTIANVGWIIQARGKTGGRSLWRRPYAAA